MRKTHEIIGDMRKTHEIIGDRNLSPSLTGVTFIHFDQYCTIRFDLYYSIRSRYSVQLYDRCEFS